MRGTFKRLGPSFLVFLLVLAGVVFFVGKPKPIPPLPFDAGIFISTPPPHSLLELPANAPALARLKFYLFVTLPQKFSRNKTGTWSFPISPKTGCSIQGLLNECSEVNETRYLMPSSVAAGSVQFGNATVLNGPQWVAAFEKELQAGDVQYWDAQTKNMKHEHLVLLRFPLQKTVVVLPESGADYFLRTNGIRLLPAESK